MEKISSPYIPNENEGHPDHKEVNKIALEAISFSPGRWLKKYNSVENSWKIPLVLSYEITVYLKNYYTVDITDFIDIKIESLKKHASQMTINRDYAEVAKALNANRGAINLGNGKYGECFEVLRSTEEVIEKYIKSD